MFQEKRAGAVQESHAARNVGADLLASASGPAIPDLGDLRQNLTPRDQERSLVAQNAVVKLQDLSPEKKQVVGRWIESTRRLLDAAENAIINNEPAKVQQLSDRFDSNLRSMLNAVGGNLRIPDGAGRGAVLAPNADLQYDPGKGKQDLTRWHFKDATGRDIMAIPALNSAEALLNMK